MLTGAAASVLGGSGSQKADLADSRADSNHGDGLPYAPLLLPLSAHTPGETSGYSDKARL